MVSVCDLCEIKARVPYRGKKYLLNVYCVLSIAILCFMSMTIHEHVFVLNLRELGITLFTNKKTEAW